MSININSNIVIVGGGVAGLWLANLCKNLNYDFILLEKNQLGSGQTIQSQGIIHGGLKYALGGKLSDSSESIRNMPAIWQACLENKGQIPLNQVKVLSNNQFLWSTGVLDNMSNFFASKNLSSRVTKLSRAYYPSILQTKDFVGSVYKLEELVLDIQSVLHTLAKNVEHNLAKIDAIQVNTYLDNNKNIQHLSTIINNQKFNNPYLHQCTQLYFMNRMIYASRKISLQIRTTTFDTSHWPCDRLIQQQPPTEY